MSDDPYEEFSSRSSRNLAKDLLVVWGVILSQAKFSDQDRIDALVNAIVDRLLDADDSK